MSGEPGEEQELCPPQMARPAGPQGNNEDIDLNSCQKTTAR